MSSEVKERSESEKQFHFLQVVTHTNNLYCSMKDFEEHSSLRNNVKKDFNLATKHLDRFLTSITKNADFKFYESIQERSKEVDQITPYLYAMDLKCLKEVKELVIGYYQNKVKEIELQRYKERNT
jgi:hypothetical protein